MTAFLTALALSFALALIRLAASMFEAVFYHVDNGQYRTAFKAFARALVYVALLSGVLRPFVDWFNETSISIVEPSFDKDTRIIDDGSYNRQI